jgi:hypothetical protein
VAFSKWPLSAAIAELPFGYYVIGDNTYGLAPTMLVPFTKPEIKSSAYSGYNFYISQLRNRIEMSFGLLVNKWHIFKRPLTVDFNHADLVIKTSMKLHNFCIDDRVQSSPGLKGTTAALQEYNALESCTYYSSAIDDCPTASVLKNEHILRPIVLEHIQNHNWVRPREVSFMNHH